MNKDLVKILSELKSIAPDADYSAKLRNLLLAEINTDKRTAPERFSLADVLVAVYSRRPIYVIAATAFALILIVSSSAFYTVNEINKHDFVVKAGEVNNSIQVKLDEIKYLLGSKEIDYNKSVIIQTMLLGATEDLKKASEEKDTNKSLEKIKSAQETLYKIDVLLQNK
ncbi:MAG: hypothetical protein D4Q79_01735 [Spirochaetia bacterium]|nr:MAG: hypothetical protein D4Q79_01735 [Spirochaetia bacterium]